MVYLRSGKAFKNGQRKAKIATKSNQAPASKKRKAEEVSPQTEEDKEDVDRPSTPSPTKSKVSIEAEDHQQEKTPGRVGPIKRVSFSASPDIKPFKGPPGKKVRKTRQEKDEEYTQFIRENENHCFHDLHVCFDKGPNGSPTYDSSGFQLDYNKVADWMRPKPYNKSAMVNGMERAMDKSARESKRMAEIFFKKGEAPAKPEYSEGVDYWKDRVSKDLNVPWHKIGVEHFEEWEKKGFKKARKGEYETFSEAETERMMRMQNGAALRK